MNHWRGWLAIDSDYSSKRVSTPTKPQGSVLQLGLCTECILRIVLHEEINDLFRPTVGKHLKLVGNSQDIEETKARHTRNMINCPGKTRCNTLSDCSCIQLLLLLLPQKFVAAFNNCASLSASFTASTAAAVNY